MLTAFPAAPFSYQRLAELLLEPRKQYSQLHKLVRRPAGPSRRWFACHFHAHLLIDLCHKDWLTLHCMWGMVRQHGLSYYEGICA